MEKDINSCFFRTLCVRLCVLFLLFVPLQARAAGWTPTDAGLVVNFSEGDQFLLSVWIDLNSNGTEDAGEEFFVCDMPEWQPSGLPESPYDYRNYENYLKLRPQQAGATEPASHSIWTVGPALTRNYQNKAYGKCELGGICYTMYSNDARTLVAETNHFQFLGKLTSKTSSDLCDVVFVVPTVQASTNMDPDNTLGKKVGTQWAFDGQTGVGFAGKVYREVYWFEIPGYNTPKSYTNAALVTFNTSNTTKSWSSNQISCAPGKAAYAYADTKHHPTQRTLFRLYNLTHPFDTCRSYFFADNEQNYVSYRIGDPDAPNPPKDTTARTLPRKIYSTDRFYKMSRVGTTKYYESVFYTIPAKDSTFYYIGKNNEYYSSSKGQFLGSCSSEPYAYSMFRCIRQLRVRDLAAEEPAIIAPVGACGRIVVDTTSCAENLGATFEPAGYFFYTNNGRHVKLRQVDDTTWMTDEVWTIKDSFMLLSGKVLLYTQPTYSTSDPGVGIPGWSEWKKAPSFPVVGQPAGVTAKGKSGWARIHTNRPDTNGGIEFVEADSLKYIRYHNNGHFGEEIPNQHAASVYSKVAVLEPRLMEGYDFAGWATNADGTGRIYQPGDTVMLDTVTLIDSKYRVLDLYAQARYTGNIHVAISFMEGGERYFMTHPGSAPRYARARHFSDWTDVYQGMSDAENSQPNYLTSYKLIGKEEGCKECETDEYVLDAHRETMYGAVDSLQFYEISTNKDEYIGLYYDDPNTVLANDTWAGLFQSTEGWPTPANACIDSTRLFSTYYLHKAVNGTGGVDTVRDERPNHDFPEIKYIAATNQFDGKARNAGTDFMLSGVGVVDAYYVILPDTTDEETLWINEITFGYHEDEQTEQQVWSKLIGKQLLAQMKVGDDTVYFHPNRNKIFTTAGALQLSSDFRLKQEVSYIRDARVESLNVVSEEDKPTLEETDNAFHYTVTSGMNTPINVIYGGNPIDMVDTLRVWLRPGINSKIKDYYGRWKTGTEGVRVRADGSRYRDILVTTKTYHYGPDLKTLRLVPEQESYSFGSLDGSYQDLNFTLQLITYHELLDVEGNLLRVDTISIADTTAILHLESDTTFTLGSGEIFAKGAQTSHGIRLTTQAENTTAINRDTLTLKTTVTLGDTPIPLTIRVPLLQVSTIGTELIWSVLHSNGKRYFIMADAAGESGIRCQHFSVDSRVLRNGKELVLGYVSKSDRQHIIPWKWTDVENSSDQLSLKTEYGVNRFFHINPTGNVPELHASDSSVLTFIIDTFYTNGNGNYEEIVRLKYGPPSGDALWLKFNLEGETASLSTTSDQEQASVFSWGYLMPEYNLLNNGTYPSKSQEEFGYNEVHTGSIQTRYKAYLDHSMLINGNLAYLCKTEENDVADLINRDKEWKTLFTDSIIRDSRVGGVSSGLSISRIDTTTLTTSITASGSSPLNVKVGGQYVDIVDTLDFRITLQDGAPSYRFKGAWSQYASVENAHLKIPLVRKSYYQIPYDSIVCTVDNDEYNFSFPSTLREGVSTDSIHTFTLSTIRRKGNRVYDVNGRVVYATSEAEVDSTDAMDLTNIAMSEVRLMDEFGTRPTWCQILRKDKHTITVKCLSSGIRSPRVAYLYFAYIVMVDSKMRFVNFRLTVSQASHFDYANNQHLIHSAGASGDPMMDDGRQYTHENKRILYYYNPKPYDEADQNVELPVRERGFYGWWRWYREGKDQNGVDVGDTDIPDSVWQTPPRNVGKHNFPFRIIGDSVWIDDDNHSLGKKLVTMGRYTVFYNPSKDYGNKANPPSKSPLVYPPFNKDTMTYVVDISNYYDKLPLQMANIKQIDTAMLDTMQHITEPTLSLREIFELRPWTEMAERLEHYKDTIASKTRNLRYMENHVVMAPTGAPLLLSTEQRYRYDHMGPQKDDKGNIIKDGHSESLLGYYMRDDHWADPEFNWSAERKDTMIWCGGWDADCVWYIFHPADSSYSECNYKVTVDDDFLQVPAKGGITAGREFDTVYYCLRARSKSTPHSGMGEDLDPEEPADGAYWFNICRYTIIYHNPTKYGPLKETTKGGITKALITNDEIEQDYEVLERLNFDYNKPGSEYRIYPHPLPWSDGSYGYTYPLSSSVPQNRFHDEKDFPGPGEYAIINRIPYTTYWRKMEQHGGADNGYMIYCDGMSSSGQVAALSLSTQLCEGQRLYFSGYVGNASKQTDKSNPNFTFSVQGSHDGEEWEDISSYMTGDIPPSDSWYQIFFPIEHEQVYTHFRVRIYNLSSDFQGNDFVIDDMCIFATKPPLIAYQANTKCVEQNENDSIIHVVLRVDYQGFIDKNLNNTDVHYTVEQISEDVHSFVPMIDGYLNGDTVRGADVSKPDTIYGRIRMPDFSYEPSSDDSIFVNLNQLAERFEQSLDSNAKNPAYPLFRQGYIYENLDGDVRPVLYVVHKAKMTADKTYLVRMSLSRASLMSSDCAMTSNLKVTNRMMLMLNDEEQAQKEVSGICGNVTYDLSLRVRGTLMMDSVAPVDLAGSCKNDWLLYGDTAEASSLERYGYRYSDIEKVVKDILRYEPGQGETNSNQFARSLGSVNRNVMARIWQNNKITLQTKDEPYVVLKNLVNNGFLLLYQSNLMVSIGHGDSVQYVIFPILGTGSDEMHNQNMEVCPTPLVIKLKSRANESGSPMIIGGLLRDSTQMNKPVIVLANASTVSSGVAIPIDSIQPLIGVRAAVLISTDDPNYRTGVHILEMSPDKVWPMAEIENYYHKGDTMILMPSMTNNYQMRPGYSYTYNLEMVSPSGDTNRENEDCPIGNVPFTISYVPDYLRWNPASTENNEWNNPENWLGINQQNRPIHNDAHFVPLPTTNVIIPALTASQPYPVIPDSSAFNADSVQEVGFAYNTCGSIRFLPGAAIGQQQNLVCDNAIVDMGIPQQTWAFRSAPVTGMVSGDLFMSYADLNAESTPWEVGGFDATSRNYKLGTASFWLSVYSRETIHMETDGTETYRTAEADWSKVTNGLTLSLPPAQGWAVYTRTKSGNAAAVRLPKSDDTYYYYSNWGEPTSGVSVSRGEGAGKLAYHPDSVGTPRYTLTNEVASTSFVFGNPTMGYIDIWGFIADNGLTENISYLNASGTYTTVSKASALATPNTLSNVQRYLPPMHAMVITTESATSKVVKLDTRYVVTDTVHHDIPVAAPKRTAQGQTDYDPRPRGIMTITAINPASSLCTTRLLLGQGYHDAILSGEDAVLTTVNINNFSTSTPTTPFTIYAAEEDYGLSIDLRDSIVYVPLSFRMSDLEFEPVTYLWFTGVSAIDGPLVLYDMLTDTERLIIDGICLDIETPLMSHELRYYIRRPGYNPQHDSGNPVATGINQTTNNQQPTTTKILRNGHVYILRNGHVYTMFGQQIR